MTTQPSDEQCRLALQEILRALPERGRLNASDVHWLRSVALAGLGADPLGAELVTLETVQLRADLEAAQQREDALVLGLRSVHAVQVTELSGKNAGERFYSALETIVAAHDARKKEATP